MTDQKQQEPEQRIRTATIRICQDCVDLKGEECHTPECVFCFRSVTEAKRLMDKMLIAPIIDGERFILVDDDADLPRPLPDNQKIAEIRERQGKRRRQPVRSYHLMHVGELLDEIDYLLSVYPATEARRCVNVDALWEALKLECCKKPDEAKLIVFLTEKRFRDVMSKCVFATTGAEGEQRPRIICLCGSTRFIELFAIKTWELEREGNIVLGCTLLPMWYCNTPSHFGEATGTKEQCDELHKRKIDLADEVLVLDVDGYIGESTRAEIEYATARGKPIRYLSRESDTSPLPVAEGQETEVCPVCHATVPLDSLLSYNNIPNAFCSNCSGEPE